MRVCLSLLASALLLTVPGCNRWGPATTPRPVLRPTPAFLAYYEAGGEVPEAESVELEHRGEHWELSRILVPARVPDELADYPHARDPIEILHFRPRPRGGTPRPLVLMSPILGNSTTLMPEFATGFVRLGYHAAVVVRKEFSFDPATALDDAEREFRVLVMRSRQALDWMAAREEVDGDRVATFGVSAGAIISACLAGADPRPRAHVLVLAGGPLADVLVDTEEDRFHRYIDEMQEEKSWSSEEIRTRLREAIRTDPVRLAPRVPRESVLMFVAQGDRSVPTRHGLTLWNALGRPRLFWLPFGHYVSFLFQPWIQAEANRFLRSRLGPP